MAKRVSKRISWRSTFNPDRDFVVMRSMLGMKRGDAFNKATVSARRLRQLFDQRVIHYPAETPGAITDAAKNRRRGGPTLIVELLNAAGFGPAEDEARLRAAVEIPPDWATMGWIKRRALASLFTDDPVKNGEDAARSIEAELRRRGTV